MKLIHTAIAVFLTAVVGYLFYQSCFVQIVLQGSDKGPCDCYEHVPFHCLSPEEQAEIAAEPEWLIRERKVLTGEDK